MTHTSTEQPEALGRLRQRLKFTHSRQGHTARFVEAKECDVKAVIDLADSLHARVQELEAQLVKEAARTAEQKLRADQLEKQHAMQAKMHSQAAEQLAAAQQVVQNGTTLVQLSVLSDARDTAMQWCIKGRIPECGAFAQIAQDLDAMIAAAPQPPEAAPVQMPEPIGELLDSPHDDDGLLSWYTENRPPVGSKLYTEHQVRQLLAQHVNT